MIALAGISKTFNKGNPNESVILTNLDLQINDKDFIIVVGSNGSGKSTLLNIIAGTLKHDKGTIVLNGTDISTAYDYERSRWISRIFQDPLAGTSPDLSVLENFRLASLRG